MCLGGGYPFLASRGLFFYVTPTPEIYTLSLLDALPISVRLGVAPSRSFRALAIACAGVAASCARIDRKSTRLNSSHTVMSYAVFCLKKKNYGHKHTMELASLIGHEAP